MNKYQLLQSMKTPRVLSTKSLSFVHQRMSFEGKEKWRSRKRTQHHSDERGKMWEVREFFYPVEVKDLVVIHIYRCQQISYLICWAKSPLCEKEMTFLPRGQKYREVIKIGQLRWMNEIAALWWVFPTCLGYQDPRWHLKVRNLTVRDSWHWEQSILIQVWVPIGNPAHI